MSHPIEGVNPPPETALDEHLHHFQTRVIRDAFNEATAAYWLRRAAQFEAARPRPTDYLGTAGEFGRQAVDRRLRDAAADCRAKAERTRGMVA